MQPQNQAFASDQSEVGRLTRQIDPSWNHTISKHVGVAKHEIFNKKSVTNSVGRSVSEAVSPFQVFYLPNNTRIGHIEQKEGTEKRLLSFFFKEPDQLFTTIHIWKERERSQSGSLDSELKLLKGWDK